MATKRKRANKPHTKTSSSSAKSSTRSTKSTVSSSTTRSSHASSKATPKAAVAKSATVSKPKKAVSPTQAKVEQTKKETVTTPAPNVKVAATAAAEPAQPKASAATKAPKVTKATKPKETPQVSATPESPVQAPTAPTAKPESKKADSGVAKPEAKVAGKPEPQAETKAQQPETDNEPTPKPAQANESTAEPKEEVEAKPETTTVATKEESTAKAQPNSKPIAQPEAKTKEEPEKETSEDVKAEAAHKLEATPEVPAEPQSEDKKEVETVSDEQQQAEDATTQPEENAPEQANDSEAQDDALPEPRRSVAFIGSECYPFVKTGGLGDVMYSLPKALIAQNCDVKVIIPNYACIKQEWKDKMVYRGSFYMDLCSDGHSYYVGIMEYVADSGVVYDFIDNQEFFSAGNPYINLVDDIPKFCYFSKAALAALNYMNWIPDVIHCHDWQASLVPIYLRTMFNETPIARAKTVLTIHNLRFQGVYNIPTLKYWTNLPDYVFNKDVLQEFWTEANMLKGGITYANMVTTVSNTYAHEIQTQEYGEGLDAHLRYHSGKLRGIVNGIDYDLWNPATDKLLEAPYDSSNALEQKRKNKLALQKELGLEENPDKMMIGLVSRLTSQKGLDLVNSVLPAIIDGNTQVVILGTGEPDYENSFRYYENEYKGQVCSNIMYDEGRAHKIYAGADAILVPSRFEPCGLTQLIAMHYGTVPIVRETGGLKDTVQPYNKYTNDGNGFTFDRYEAGLLYDAINRAKTLYFTNRTFWDQMVQRDMAKDVSWDNSARQYRWLYLELTA